MGAEAAGLSRLELVGDVLWRARLESGLWVYVLPKPGWRQKYAVIGFHYGSMDSRFVPPGSEQAVEVPPGIAHFLEHKLFEKADGDVFSRFARMGVSSNAYTSYSVTAYLFSAVDHFTEALEVLLRFVQEPYFTEASVAKEQGIIEQELRMYEDYPPHRLGLQLLQALYWKHPVRVDIGGTVESIRKIDRDLLYLCYNTFYHPGNMALAAAGDFDPEAVRERVGRRVAAFGPRHEPVRRVLPAEPPEPREHWVESRLPVAQPLFALGFKDRVTGLTGRELLRRELLVDTGLHLLIGPASDLYEELYRSGLIDDDFRCHTSVTPEFSHVVLEGETPDPRRLHQALLEAFEARLAAGFDEAEVQRARRRSLGEFIASLDSPEFLANATLSLHVRNAHLFWLPELLSDVGAGEVGAVLREILRPEAAAASVVLPVDQPHGASRAPGTP